MPGNIFGERMNACTTRSSMLFRLNGTATTSLMLPVNLNSDPLSIDSAVSPDSVLSQYEKRDCLQPRSVSKLGRLKHVPMEPSSIMWEESGSYARLSCTVAVRYCDRNCASVKTSRHCRGGGGGGGGERYRGSLLYCCKGNVCRGGRSSFG